MNDELDKLLKQAKVPERSLGYWEHFPKRVIVNLDSRLEAAPFGWRWAVGVAAACLVLGLIFWPRSQPTPRTDYAALYRQIAGMFPGQVRAIVKDETGVHLVLSETADVPASRPLFVKLCRPASCREMVTFSGQCVQLNDQTVEVLVDGHGGVHVIGDRSIEQPTEARAL